MKYLYFKRKTKIKTLPSICLDVLFDYTHFLYKHKTSFKDVRLIEENHNKQVFYYESNIINWFPISPVKRLITIKKLFPKKKMFHQVFLDLKTKQITYAKVYMTNTNGVITINNLYIIPVSNFLYLFKKIILWLVNKKFETMWQEDREMMIQMHKRKDYKNIKCVPPYFNLDNILEKKLESKFSRIKK